MFLDRDAQGYFEFGSFGNLERMTTEDLLDELEGVDDSESEADEDEESNDEAVEPEADPDLSSSGASEVDDEEFARRLHVQEQVEQQRRYLEMAGKPDVMLQTDS